MNQLSTTLPPVEPRRESPRTDRALEHKVYDRFDDPSLSRDQWDDFVIRSGGDLYCSYEWCRIWWKYYGKGRQLQIHLFRAGGEIVAILPLFFEKISLAGIALRCVRIIGCDHSVTTCSIAVVPDHMNEVVGSLIDWLSETTPWDILHLGPLGGYFEYGAALAEALRSHADVEKVIENQEGPQILIDLPGSFDDYMASLRGGERNNIRRGEKHLREKFDPQVRVAAEADFDEHFDLFVRQHQQQWQLEGQLGHFVDWPAAEEFHRELASAHLKLGRLQLLWIVTNQGTIGYQYNYLFNRRMFWILGSRSPDNCWDHISPGQRLHCETVRLLISQGYTQIDAMRGMYEYKLRLGGRVVHLHSITAVGKKPGSARRFAAFRKMSRLLHLLYYRIWFGRIAPKIPALRRPLWIKWIRSRL